MSLALRTATDADIDLILDLCAEAAGNAARPPDTRQAVTALLGATTCTGSRSAAGLALASLRNYAHTLHAELGPQGVYAGALLIGALIEGTPAHRNATAWAGGQQLPVVKPEDLAGHFWDLYTQRDRAEAEA